MSDSLLKDAPATAAHPLPDWFRKSQKAAAARFDSLPMPTRRDESWRFSNLKAVDPQDFAPARPVAPALAAALLERSLGLKSPAGCNVFANDRLLAHQLNPELAAQGVVWLSIEEALQSHGELLKGHLLKNTPILGSDKFLALHQASLRAGSFLYVPKGVHIEAPLQTFHWVAGSGLAVFPHTLVVAEEGSSATVVDWFKSEGEARNLAVAANDLVVAKDAKVHYVSVQDWSRQSISLHSNNTNVAAGGAALHLGLHLGGVYSRSESVSRLEGTGARSEMLAATVADGAQEFDQRTLQEHGSPDTYSDLLYKNALYDRAKTIVSGLIRVAPHAHRTDAYQKVRNLILSPDAEANSLPGLEILADQVRCSHGATTGEIDPDELFYMQSRGIPSTDAYRLITFGFLNEVLERLPHEELRSQLQDALKARLRGH